MNAAEIFKLLGAYIIVPIIAPLITLTTLPAWFPVKETRSAVIASCSWNTLDGEHVEKTMGNTVCLPVQPNGKPTPNHISFGPDFDCKRLDASAMRIIGKQQSLVPGPISFKVIGKDRTGRVGHTPDDMRVMALDDGQTIEFCGKYIVRGPKSDWQYSDIDIAIEYKVTSELLKRLDLYIAAFLGVIVGAVAVGGAMWIRRHNLALRLRLP